MAKYKKKCSSACMIPAGGKAKPEKYNATAANITECLLNQDSMYPMRWASKRA
jgi:hypothetical protein